MPEVTTAKRVLVLVGPKGSGKTTIGCLLEARMSIPFVRVEPLFLAVRDALGPSHPDFERRGFEAVLARLTLELTRVDAVCFESTGVSAHVRPLLRELERLARVLLVQIACDPDECVRRIHGRDQTVHIPVSDDQVDRINAAAIRIELPWTKRIDNRAPFDPDRIVAAIAPLLSA